MRKEMIRRFCLAILALTSIGVILSQQQSGAATPESAWAIAIHGGAGGDPGTWAEKDREARRLGLQKALKVGKGVLASGGTSLDAVEAVIRVLEDDPIFNAGRGAVLTDKGRAELDASIMDGKTRSCGAVAGVTTTKNPIGLARLVMSETKHVLLAGPGADEFSRKNKVPQVKPDYFLSSLTSPVDVQPHLGTVGCVALDTHGNLAAGTSTGGTSKKLPGRVGDSPIVGAGTFAANGACAVSGTGVGEEYIRNAVAYDIVAQMTYGNRPLVTAVTNVMTETLKPGIGGLICVGQDGQIVMQHNTPGMSCGAADSTGRFETHLELENGGRSQNEANETDEEEIERLLLQQSSDWNAGSIDQFMKIYWKSEKLTFSSGGKTTRGWDATRDGYKKRYPNKEAMGTLTFSELELTRLDANAFQVLGTWALQRDKDPIGGRFTLILKRFGRDWRIVHDHTSALK